MLAFRLLKVAVEVEGTASSSEYILNCSARRFFVELDGVRPFTLGLFLGVFLGVFLGLLRFRGLFFLLKSSSLLEKRTLFLFQNFQILFHYLASTKICLALEQTILLLPEF